MVAYITHTHGSHAQAGQHGAAGGDDLACHDVYVAPRGRSPVALRLQQRQPHTPEQKTSESRSNDDCARCGRSPADGFATIDDERYCHEGPDPTCYMLTSWEKAGVVSGVPFPERAT